jgi:uncharacterized Fe-S cluster protein YjdI
VSSEGEQGGAQELHEYSTRELTVEWRPSICQHSGVCARGLAAVFNPRRRPWVDINAASADAIEDVVSRCPSGALRVRRSQP